MKNLKKFLLIFIIAFNTTVLMYGANSLGFNAVFFISDTLAPSVENTQISKKIILAGTLAVTLNVFDASGVDYIIQPSVYVLFADGSSKNLAITSYNNEVLSAKVTLLNTDKQGLASVFIKNLTDIYGNSYAGIVATFNKIAIDDGGSVNSIQPTLSKVVINSRYLSLNSVLSMNITLSDNIPVLVDKAISPIIRFTYSDLTIEEMIASINQYNQISLNKLITGHEGLVTVDLIKVYDNLALSQDFLVIATLNFDFTPPSYSWNIATHTFVINYPLEISFNEPARVSYNVNGIGASTTVNTLFKTSVTLNTGTNLISIQAFDYSGNETSMNKTVVVSPLIVTISVGSATYDVVQVDVPTGSITQNLSLSINIRASADMPANVSLNGMLFDIRFLDDNQQRITINLLKPLVVRLPFYGTNNTQVAVKYLDQTVTPAVWSNQGITLITINVNEHYVMFSVTHLTLFGVFIYSDSNDPVIGNIKVNNKLIISGSYIDSLPVFTIAVTDQSPSDSGVCSYNVTLQKKDLSYQNIVSGNYNNLASVTITMNLSTGTQLAEGEYSLRINVEDGAQRTTSSSINLFVAGSVVIYNFLAGPNPININLQTLHFTYSLSKNSPVKLKVFDVAGHKVKEISASAGFNGGSFGLNDLVWNGYSDSGLKIPAGLYFVYLQVEDGANKATAKFMLLVTK